MTSTSLDQMLNVQHPTDESMAGRSNGATCGHLRRLQTTATGPLTGRIFGRPQLNFGLFVSGLKGVACCPSTSGKQF